jgi:Ricin-type beta-trefoil lectin domain
MDSVDPPTESYIMPGMSLVMPPVETPIAPIAPIAPTQKPTLSTKLNVVEYQIKSKWAGEYLTLSDNTPGAHITLEPWNAQLPSQRWYKEFADNLDFPNHHWLRCKLDNYYLAAMEGENDAYVVGWNLDPEKSGLTWTLKKVKGNIYHIVNSWNGMCLSATPSAEGYGDVVVKDCQSVEIQQQWLLEKVD